jgi:hypothetical protein
LCEELKDAQSVSAKGIAYPPPGLQPWRSNIRAKSASEATFQCPMSSSGIARAGGFSSAPTAGSELRFAAFKRESEPDCLEKPGEGSNGVNVNACVWWVERRLVKNEGHDGC